ncbi:glycosyltransferase family 2 protein [Ornithobacterium rhinotracheale]|uniref:glycosyltransferase family 2 protein n=1 Tax=Ornithobacterium rhinotracheale TaxID=28251 RepID=UPI001FF1779F|nr:glycosyltransferase family 2 protein [Ornithobacterium rhinotracheale]MCK0199837.1 glycosyltransferase family 2 protein [Ornithobacterium rhinotracheale]
MEISVITSTYNAKEWLQKVLWGYNQQTFQDFELVIADDGSREDTREMIEDFKKIAKFPITHVWHEDRGFQKSEILNKAVVQCKAPYIIMSDGDCIPRKDFVEVHFKNKEKGRFLSGGYFMLPMNISELISEDDIVQQRCFDVKWLVANGLKKSFKNNKLSASGLKEKLLNHITPTKPTWNGHNASGWKEDIVAVNGLDERMQYGGQDRELGERLENYGIRGKQIRYSAIVVHLDHARGYVNKESWEKNHAIRKNTRDNKIKRTPFGIVKD